MAAVSKLILAVWYLSIFAKTLLIAVMVRRGLARGYPLFLAYLLTSESKSLWLVYCLHHGGAAAYQSAWISGQGLSIGLYALISLEAFYLHMCHFKNMSWFAAILASTFAGVSLLIGWSTSGIGAAIWNGHAQYLILLTRYYSGGCLIFIALSVWFCGLFPNIGMRPNLRAHVRILMFFFAGEFLGSALEYGTAGKWMIITQSWLTSWPLLCMILWILNMRQDGEAVPQINYDSIEAHELTAFEEKLRKHAKALRGAFKDPPQ